MRGEQHSVPDGVRQSVRCSSGLELLLAEATAADRDELFGLFTLVVAEGNAFPTRPPATEDDYDRAWDSGKTAVMVARAGASLVGSYYLVQNFGGRAAHIANAGYMVQPDFRGRGAGHALVEHSIGEARRLGFDALMFNLVFESNPARRLYEQLGFEVIGRVPRAVEGEDALIYWRAV